MGRLGDGPGKEKVATPDFLLRRNWFGSRFDKRNLAVSLGDGWLFAGSALGLNRGCGEYHRYSYQDRGKKKIAERRQKAHNDEIKRILQIRQEKIKADRSDTSRSIRG